jgi:hypothetical protein
LLPVGRRKRSALFGCCARDDFSSVSFIVQLRLSFLHQGQGA